MLQVRHTTLITISGLIWFAIGFFLLQLGLNLIVAGSHAEPNSVASHYPLLTKLASLVGSFDVAAIIIIAFSLFLGYFKGKYMLGKAVKKGTDRIKTLPNPVSITKIYNLRYYLLLAVMISLGMSIKYFHIPGDIRGGIDVLIGAALINGALIYFRIAAESKKKSVTT